MATPTKPSSLGHNTLDTLLFKVLSIIFVVLLVGQASAAESISIPPSGDCFLCSSKSTMTLYWPSKTPGALLIYIPGGDGHFGLKEGQTKTYNRFVNYLATLASAQLTQGKISLVLIDSPEPLSPNQMYPTSRANEDHLMRIESVVEYYKHKTGLPIWLLGHSAGGISLSHFVDYEKRRNKLSLLSGLIASGVRNESYFDDPILCPVLVIHNREDACYLTRPIYAKRLFDQLKTNSRESAEFVLIDGGEPEDDPCTGGFHMYFEAETTFVDEVQRFITSRPAPFYLKPN